MVMKPRTWKLKLNILLFLMITFAVIPSMPGCSHAQEETNHSLTAVSIVSSHGKVRTVQDNAAAKPETVCLYTVVDGRVQPKVFQMNDLRKVERVNIEGYVSGVVVFLEREIPVRMGGKLLKRTERLAAERRLLRDFGFLPVGSPDPPKLASDGGNHPDEKTDLIDGRSMEHLKAYCLFPDVSGNTISNTPAFGIAFDDPANKWEIQITQQGVEDFCLIPAPSDQVLTFQYIGTRLDKLRAMHSSFDDRLKAVADGIQGVESAFDADLVHQVNIIDREGIQNAITSREGGEIWLYVDALMNEPTDELRVMAAHETLHKLVGKLGLPANARIRKLFARLRGYDLFSSERLTLVMTGVTPSTNTQGQGEHPLLPFIDENHFFEGMKGGHSGENLDEFCTSMIHSLLFVDRLSENLDRPVIPAGVSTGSGSWAQSDKLAILQEYANAIECLIKALPKKTAGENERLVSAARKIFDVGMKTVNEVNAALDGQNASLATGPMLLPVP